MEIIGWILWAIVAYFAASSLYVFIKKSGGLQAGTVSTMVNQLILVGWPLYFSDFNKLHLAWLGPLTLFWGVPATFVFAFIRSKWIILGLAVAINLLLLVLIT